MGSLSRRQLMRNTELIFVAFGSLGDVYPLLAVAQRMNERGHQVVFLSNEYFRNEVEFRSVQFYSIGDTESQLAAKETKESTGETVEGRVHRFENIIGKSFLRTYEYIENCIKRGERPVVISHGNLSPAALACEKFHVPMILTHYAPAQIPGNEEDKVMTAVFYGRNEWYVRHVLMPYQKFVASFTLDIKRNLNAYRKAMGLPLFRNKIVRTVQKLFPENIWPRMRLFVPMEIVMVPKWFCDPISNDISHLRFAGFPIVPTQSSLDASEIAQFISTYGKPLVFTPGSAVEDVDEFCKMVIPICRKVGSSAIFVSRHGRAAFDAIEKVGDVALLYVEHADFATLLPQCRCLIHHGGIGTIAQAVKAGIPQIVRPRMYDQPANGIRVMMYGLGGSILPNGYDADTVARILTHLENHPKNVQLLKHYSQLVNQEDGVTNCCDAIEEYLARSAANESPAKNLTVS